MVGRYRRNTENNRSRFYFLLSIVFIFVVFKWGIPLFIKIIAGNGVAVNKNQEDIIPPQVPLLSAVSEATNSSQITLEGYTESGATVELMVNDMLSKTDKAKEDGAFTFLADLSSGSNRVQIRAVDAVGNASLSEIKMVTVDKEPIELVISSPKDGAEYIGKNSQTVELVGKINKSNTQLMANNYFVDVSKDGSFNQKFQLNSGENTIKFIASDKAGNIDEKTIKVLYTP